MNYESAIHSLEQDGFRWELFREYFPFGDVSLREGNYQRLAQAALAAVGTRDEQQLLLDLLDAQACVYTEQVWVANEMAERAGVAKPFTIEAHFSTAWLQINDNLRHANDLKTRGARTAMLNLQPPETLAARITRSHGGKHGDA